ncbi:peptidoglycan-binding protein [Micromonospora sp. NPDC051296]|uniref:peptidoglycan-binding domain-containing protein n=1 Tax=Micromonospora sp. NPDC051296 TaxID=3155046 RepID=UPI003423662F
MLTSQLLGSSADLRNVSTVGGRRIKEPESSDSVALVQQALIATTMSLPDHGVDDWFGTETGNAVSAYKAAHGLSPTDPVVGTGTITALDTEISYLEGAPSPQALQKPGVLALDPFFAGVLENNLGDVSIGQRALDFFELSDRICFRLSFALSGPVAQWMSEEVVEPVLFADYRAKQAPVTSADFFDSSKSSRDYVDFLLVQHPTLDPVRIGALGRQKRPDILRHRPTGSEWYELKPASIAGAIGAWAKFMEIPKNYASVGLPYLPGRAYVPTEFIPIATFFTPQGERLQLVAQLRRKAPGLIFWSLCVRGDYVSYFNRVRIAAGLLAMIALLAELAAAAAATAAAAEAATAVVAAVQEIAVGLGVTLPALLTQP